MISTHLKGVVLFDIDGTLISGSTDRQSAGLLSMKRALSQLTGFPLLPANIDFSGQTDKGIAKSFLEQSGLEATAHNVTTFLSYYLQFLSQEIVSRPYHPLGNCKGAVQSLQKAGFICGIGTGNLKQGAVQKLSSAGISRYFCFDLGGYGDDSIERSEILRIGLQRCDPEGVLPVVVVGDTPRDVFAARAIGAQCIGIPFQNNSELYLKTSGAAAISNYVGPHLVDICLDLLHSHI
jgi:phosphoglycolate phosphatase-like HAD superfamily hydrolase